MEGDMNINPFDINKACSKHFNAVIIGKRNTGKSTIIQDVLFSISKRNMPRVCIFSGTEEANGFYKQFVPGTFIHTEQYVEETLQVILDGQKELTRKLKLGKIKPDSDIRITLVLDDVGYKRGALRTEVLRQIFMNGRHYGITVILAVQYVCDVPVDLRTNTDYVFVMKQNGSVKNLYENFFSGFETLKDFKTVLNACTENYESFVLDNTMPSTDVAKVCFYFKAQFGRVFKICSPKAWNYHSRWFMTDEQRFEQAQKLKKKLKESSEPSTTTTTKTSKKGSKLVVKKN